MEVWLPILVYCTWPGNQEQQQLYDWYVKSEKKGLYKFISFLQDLQ